MAAWRVVVGADPRNRPCRPPSSRPAPPLRPPRLRLGRLRGALAKGGCPPLTSPRHPALTWGVTVIESGEFQPIGLIPSPGMSFHDLGCPVERHRVNLSVDLASRRQGVPMALDQSALCELLDALRAGGDLDLVRSGLQLVLQALIELEATQAIGAAPYERRPERTTHRNGHRARLLSTKAGDLEVRIPKLRQGAFFPALLEPRRRIDRALWAVVMESYVHGVSTRKVDDLVKALGIDTGVSKSEVSRICAELHEHVGAFRARSLAHAEFPYLFLDATYLKAHEGPHV